MAKRNGLNRVKEYRRALASLRDEEVGTALACFVFSSLSQKLDCAKAMRSIEAEPGFAGWGKFVSRPRKGLVARQSAPSPCAEGAKER